MNRSFRAKESQMHAAFRNRQQQLGDLRSSMIAKDKDEELALFLEMKNRENECNDLLFAEAPLGLNQGNSPLFNVSSSAIAPVRKAGADDFLNSENDKNDYDWLLTPPGTPLFPSLEKETEKTITSQLGASTTRPIASKSRLANSQPENTGRSSLVSKQSPSSPRLNSSGGGIRRLSSSANPGSTATPTRKSTLTTSSKSSRPSTPTLTTSSKSSRPSTPTSRTSIPSTRTMVTTTKATVSATKNAVPIIKTTTVPAAKLTVPSRSSTPLSRSTARSSTPTSRPTLSASRPTSRASTPTRRPSTPSNPATTSTSSVKTSPISKPAPVVSKQLISKQTVPSLGTSTMRSRPWKPSEIPGFSHDAPPNLRTTLPERPLLATRGRPGVPTARSSSIEPASSGRPKRQSCSPSRGRSSIGISHASGSSMPAFNRGYSKVNDDVNPVAMGTKMVERVINMRKLAPPTLDYKNSPRSNLFAKSSNLDSSGFGRTLSKKSLDMAIRHMDIRQRAPGNLRPLMTNIPASSMNSVRSRHQHSRTVSVSGSPHATSSNASSEVSVNLCGVCLDNSGIDDDLMSERGVQSSDSVRAR